MLQTEVTQRRDEGCTVPQSLVDAIAGLQPGFESSDDAPTAALWRALNALEPDGLLARAEPNDLEAIRALRPDGPRDLKWRQT